MKINVPVAGVRPTTQEGAMGHTPKNPLNALRRVCMACLLWEDTFYVDGKTVTNLITELVAKCDPKDVAALAIEAREKMHLRHLPLWLVLALVRNRTFKVASVLERVIQRPDEMCEFLAMYWKDTPNASIPKQVRLGLAAAFNKFDEYQFGKWDKPGAISIRDVMFLCHPKPSTPERAELYKRIANKTVKTPLTWETELSAGKDKKTTFESLLRERKLGYMALLRNLRGMAEAKVNEDLIVGSLINGAPNSKVLPFRFVAAGRAAPQFKPHLNTAMSRSMASMPRLQGKTVILVDRSGSMCASLSAKSDLCRLDAASALAVLMCGVCESTEVFTFNHHVAHVNGNGFDLIDQIGSPVGGTQLGKAITTVTEAVPDMTRLIVLTDEQSSDTVGPPPCPTAYMINVGTDKTGVAYGRWMSISGFSESILSFIQVLEEQGVED
jgi:60 kDa SS-A/Ro ribonucleoprotein